jgi:bacteriocin-like protein
MKTLNKSELQDINGGADPFSLTAFFITVAYALYDCYRGYKDASEGRYDP